MLTSLFGDLGPPRDPAGKTSTETDPSEGPFAATAIMETVATEVNARGQMVDRYSHDLVITGSPAQAIRDHFATTRADLETATSLITLVDPVGLWATAVIKALSDAGGRPIERLHLREHSTLRTLATIERTTLVRRHEDTLRIYHAGVRAPGSENSEIPIALMERSQLTTVIIGPMQPHSIDALLESLHAAAMLPTWRCPNLLFMLPPSAVWISNKIGAVAWPGRLHVHVLSEPMTGASSVWNAMLGLWNHVKSEPGWAGSSYGFGDARTSPAGLGEGQEHADAAALRAELRPSGGTEAATRGDGPPLDPARARQALSGMLPLDGLLGCAVVDSSTGLVLARELREDQPVDIDRAAAASTQLLAAHRQAARSMGFAEQIDEVVTTAGGRHQILRVAARRPELFLIALLDKQRTNLALARLQLLEVERALA